MVEGLRDCDTCGKPFVDDEGWKSQCVACWKNDKTWKLAVGDKAFLAMQDAYVELRDFNERVSAEFLELSEENDELKEKLKAARKRLRAARKELRERAETPLPPPPPPPPHGSLSQAQIRNLIKLCHPDKHRNSELAHEVTKWLLSQRRRR